MVQPQQPIGAAARAEIGAVVPVGRSAHRQVGTGLIVQQNQAFAQITGLSPHCVLDQDPGQYGAREQEQHKKNRENAR